MLATALFAGNALAQSSQPSFDDLARQAAAARAAGNPSTAAALYAQALQINPSWPDGWWYLGQLHYGNNEYGQAIDAFTHYLALMPNAAPATALRGLCEFELGQYSASLADIQHALALGAADDPRNAQILRYHEALLLTRLGRFEEALHAYAWFAKQDAPGSAIDVPIGLAALRISQLPADVSPEQQQQAALAGRAVFLLLGGDAASADDALQDFFRHYPSAPHLHYTWGYLLYSTDPDAAIAQFQREIAVDPHSAIAQTMLAWALLMEDQPADALPAARAAAAAEPQLPLAQLSLGRALLDTGDVKGATPILQNALALDPHNLEVHIALARAYSESGRAEDARRERLLCLQMTGSTAKTAPAMGQQEAPSAN